MTDILLLHGALGSKEQFAELTRLLEPWATVRLLDFDGHGDKINARQPFTIERFAENIVEYLDAHNLPAARIAGYSMGGYAALYLASQRPDRVERVFTLGTKFAWTPETAAKETATLDTAFLREKAPGFVRRLQSLHTEEGWESVVKNTRELLLSLGETPLLTASALATVGCPVRIALGDRDEMVSLDESVAAYKALQHGELDVLPRSRHALEKVHSDYLAHSVKDFFVS